MVTAHDVQHSLTIEQKQLYLLLSNGKENEIKGNEAKEDGRNSRDRAVARARSGLHRHDTRAFNFNNSRKLIGYRRRSGVPMTGRTASAASTYAISAYARYRSHAILFGYFPFFSPSSLQSLTPLYFCSLFFCSLFLCIYLRSYSFSYMRLLAQASIIIQILF